MIGKNSHSSQQQKLIYLIKNIQSIYWRTKLARRNKEIDYVYKWKDVISIKIPTELFTWGTDGVKNNRGDIWRRNWNSRRRGIAIYDVPLIIKLWWLKQWCGVEVDKLANEKEETPGIDFWQSRNLNKPEAAFQTSVERTVYKCCGVIGQHMEKPLKT